MTVPPPFIPQKDLIVLDDIHRAFAVDALTSSHPLSSKEDSITLPEQISEQFDTIAYSKVLAQVHKCICSLIMYVCLCTEYSMSDSLGCSSVENGV